MAEINQTLLSLTADIVTAHVGNNSVAVGDVATLIQRVHDALEGLGQQREEAPSRPEPKVSIRSSIKPDAITCLVCGKPQKLLKRHLAATHDLTPGEYRETFGLRPDYPMIAPKYAEQRRDLAKKIGLGTKRKLGPNKGGGTGRQGKKPGAKVPKANRGSATKG
jgi:predicted transcriptional regulator